MDDSALYFTLLKHVLFSAIPQMHLAKALSYNGPIKCHEEPNAKRTMLSSATAVPIMRGVVKHILSIPKDPSGQIVELSVAVKGQLYLWFKVSMHHTHVVHVAHSGHQPPHDAACLCLTEVLLPPDPLQELSTMQQL